MRRNDKDETLGENRVRTGLKTLDGCVRIDAVFKNGIFSGVTEQVAHRFRFPRFSGSHAPAWEPGCRNAFPRRSVGTRAMCSMIGGSTEKTAYLCAKFRRGMRERKDKETG